jgi:DNA-binding response OmpR family regulator
MAGDNMLEQVLVVADEATANDVAATLRIGGYEVVLATTLRHARALLAGASFAAILVAAELPDGHGLPFVAELCESLGPRVAVIVVCAPCTATMRVVALELGADDVVALPIDADELLARLGAHLRRRAPSGNSIP